MIIGQRITSVRKQKSLSQSALGKLVGTSGDVIGRYERGEMTPSIEVVLKIANALEISLDYLVGQTSLEVDKQALHRLEDISSLPEEERKIVLQVVDSLLRDFKTRQAYAS
jgi:transcriptional regulator with XRE-family HTH domain